MNSFIQSEIKRKAQAGERLTNPSSDKLKLYNQYAGTNNPYQQTQRVSTAISTPQVRNTQALQQQTQQKPSWQTYTPNSRVSNVDQVVNQYRGFTEKQSALDDTNNKYHFGNNVLDQKQMDEYTYYKNKMNDLSKRMYDLTLSEVGKGYGIGRDFSVNQLSPIQKQFYEIEDYLFNKYGVDQGKNSNYNFYGLDRDSLGMNELDANGQRMFSTADEFNQQQDLISQGYSPQMAYDIVRRNPAVQLKQMQLLNNYNQVTNPQNQQVQQLREIMAANGVYNQYRG